MSQDTKCDGCGIHLLFSARARGDGLCGPCSRSNLRVERDGLRAEIARLRALGADLRAAIPTDIGRQEAGVLERIADEIERKP